MGTCADRLLPSDARSDPERTLYIEDLSNTAAGGGLTLSAPPETTVHALKALYLAHLAEGDPGAAAEFRFIYDGAALDAASSVGARLLDGARVCAVRVRRQRVLCGA